MIARFLLLFICAATFAFSATPYKALYLTWIHDPTTTMTIQWHTDAKESATKILYKKSSETETPWITEEGTSSPLSNTQQIVHTVELTSLLPDTDYTFQIGEDKTLHRFRTLPSKNEREVTFVVGGDVYLRFPLFKKMNAQVAKLNPDFVVIGGDIAYSEKNNVKRWQIFLDQWQKQMITSDGRVIPMLPLLGNHDIQSFKKRNKKNPVPFYFFELFALPEKNISYRALDCGDYLSLVLLDTGHGAQIEGKQVEWLAQTLPTKSAFTNRFAIYHIAAYPSVYPYAGSTPEAIRREWVPLFEKFGIQAAFEHHNHAFKRTHPIKAGKVNNEEGILYLGDGAWGVRPRSPFKPKNTWYLAKTKQSSCVWHVSLTNNRCLLRAIDNNGSEIDRITLPTK